MALSNSKDSYYKLIGLKPPKSSEEWMIYHIIDNFEKEYFSEGLSILFFYLLEKFEDSGIDILIMNNLTELQSYMSNMGEYAEDLLSILSNKEFHTEKDLIRIHHLKEMAKINDSNLELFTPIGIKSHEKDEYQCKDFFSTLFSFRESMTKAMIELTTFDELINKIVTMIDEMKMAINYDVDFQTTSPAAFPKIYSHLKCWKLLNIICDYFSFLQPENESEIDMKLFIEKNKDILKSMDYLDLIQLQEIRLPFQDFYENEHLPF